MLPTLGQAEPEWLAEVRAAGEAYRAGWQTDWYESQLIGWLLRMHGAKRILEIGTLAGYSALSMAHALPDARIVTLEKDAATASLARKLVANSPCTGRVEVRVGDAMALMEAMRDKPFDALFIDAEKRRYPDYLSAALPLLNDHALIIADNALLDGEIYEGAAKGTFSNEARNGMRKFLAMLGERKQFDATILPTRAGLAVARRVCR